MTEWVSEWVSEITEPFHKKRSDNLYFFIYIFCRKKLHFLPTYIPTYLPTYLFDSSDCSNSNDSSDIRDSSDSSE